MKTLLITPPLTQPNCPYPATAYLKGFLMASGQEAEHADLGIELVDALFTGPVLRRVFERAASVPSRRRSPGTRAVLAEQERYLATVDAVMRFLRGQDATLATRLCNPAYLPHGLRAGAAADLDWAFGAVGLTERARHLATIYVEELTDLIAECVSPHFRLGRYADHLAVDAPDFAPLQAALEAPPDLVDELMLDLLDDQVRRHRPDLIGFTLPFPGNVYAALRCGRHLKAQRPEVSIVWGGGYVSTELRQLAEPRVFDQVDFIVFDHGEAALLRLIEHLEGRRPEAELTRTMRCREGVVVWAGNGASAQEPLPAASIEEATPDYSGLPLDRYVSLIEVANPMHKLWSDGHWNKLLLARGCYWARCTFCDTSLPHIAGYRPGDAAAVVDRMERVMRQTGSSGFHFVDEAAPPRLLRDVSHELLRRKLQTSWWTNIRFEKSYTPALCALMAEAGCIAVSGGLEVASNRVLQRIDKGVTVEQAAAVAAHLSAEGIMVHAYLMYGFPGQTMRDTMDGLEIVRQLFAEGWVQSAFWHRYAMTVHSPSGMDPARFGARRLDTRPSTFANNEVPFSDGQDLPLDMLGEGLRRATYNYMHNLGLDLPIQHWFEDRVPRASIRRDHLRRALG